MAVLPKSLILAGLVSTAVAWSPVPRGPAPEGGGLPSDSVERARALHALNRLTFGPRAGDVDRVVALGVDRYIDQQLAAERIDDGLVERRLARFDVLRLSSEELARIYLEEQRARRQRQQAGGRDSAAEEPQMPQMPQGRQLPRARRLAGELQQATMVRATLSERQLYEVMVDVWSNHFNVFMGKGADRFLVPDYIERTIRPHAMGKFEDLLVATARSPAMLFYLDNVQSVAPGSRPPGRARAGERLPVGLNENYARELMELHTLGVDGGYTQQDVINVARILTGWSMTPPPRGARFVFHHWAHDRGAKIVLGRTFPAGRGQEEGLELLTLLARHPSTMRHVSAKLCARFLADDPPDGCIDAGVQAWERTGGEIREILRAIFRSNEFWTPAYRGAKVKTPLEFVVSAVRAVGGVPDSTLALAQLVGRLGQPLYLQPAPTGYPETQESWVNSGALLERLNVAMGLAAGRAPGVALNLEALIASWADAAQLAELVNRRILSGGASRNTLRVIQEQTASLAPAQARMMAVGLALGSPEFQRQ
jgi:uncharacterized protein (DUF1800 family)